MFSVSTFYFSSLTFPVYPTNPYEYSLVSQFKVQLQENTGLILKFNNIELHKGVANCTNSDKYSS